MKVSFIVQDLCGQGAQASTAAMVRAFVRHGFDVEVLLSIVHRQKVESGMYAFPLPENVQVTYMPSAHARGNILFIRSYIKSKKSDILVSTSGPYHKCHAIAKTGLHNDMIHVCMDHGNWFGCEKCWWGSFVFCGFDRHLFVNKTSCENFLKQYPQYPAAKTHVVFNPCVDELFFEKLKLSPTHPWLKNKEMPTFITAGAYCDSKQHIVLLKAFNELNGRLDARLILFGDGPLRREYGSYIKSHSLEDRVSVWGFSKSLPAEMKAADGYLMASNDESFGIVIVEALAAGIHVISTDAPYGPRDILEDGKYGDLVPVGDYKEIARRIENFIALPRKPVPKDAWMRFTEDAVFEYFKQGLGI